MYQTQRQQTAQWVDLFINRVSAETVKPGKWKWSLNMRNWQKVMKFYQFCPRIWVNLKKFLLTFENLAWVQKVHIFWTFPQYVANQNLSREMLIENGDSYSQNISFFRAMNMFWNCFYANPMQRLTIREIVIVELYHLQTCFGSYKQFISVLSNNLNNLNTSFVLFLYV